jgi:hypothetical protein
MSRRDPARSVDRVTSGDRTTEAAMTTGDWTETAVTERIASLRREAEPS